jgi:hypothetical protein
MSGAAMMLRARQRVRGGTPPIPPPPEGVTVVDAAIQRFDGGSGTAWFRGTIPFAPGVVEDASDLTTVRVLVDGSEPSSGLFIELIEGYHPDDSYKAARIEFQATVNDANPVTCEVRIGEARTVTDRTTAQNTVEFTPRSWQLAPTLFGITDATYLCNSRIAPMPLVPDDDSRIPAPLKAYITNGTRGFDWLAASTNSGLSQYDDPYAFYTRYLTTGDLSYMAEATARHASNNASGEKVTVIGFNYYTVTPDWPYDDQTYPNANAVSPVNVNPIGYTSVNGPGSPNEPFNMTTSQLMTYWLTGWEYGRLHVERGGLLSDFRWTQGTSATTFNELRNTVRRRLLTHIAAAVLDPQREYDFKSGNVFRSGTAAWGAEAAGKSQKERTVREMARHQLYRDTVLAPPSYMTPMLGFSTDAANNTNGSGTPNFQWEFGWVFVFAYLSGIVVDDDMLDEAQRYGEWLLTQVAPLRTATNLSNRQIYPMPYSSTDPAVIAAGTGTADTGNINGTYCMMVAPMFALLYALTGNTTARDLFDDLMVRADDQFNAFSTPGNDPGTVGGEARTIKLFGQCMQVIRHAVAWRVNGFVGWEATP